MKFKTSVSDVERREAFYDRDDDSLLDSESDYDDNYERFESPYQLSLVTDDYSNHSYSQMGENNFDDDESFVLPQFGAKPEDLMQEKCDDVQ